KILFLPCLVALGVGLSLNNARAVLEALFNHKSDFTRTPKYGIERKSQPCGPANTDRTNRRSHSQSWLSRFISPTSFGSQLSMDSSSPFRSCSCSKPVFFTSVSLPWRLAGPRSALVVRHRRPQFPRDKMQIVE